MLLDPSVMSDVRMRLPRNSTPVHHFAMTLNEARALATWVGSVVLTPPSASVAGPASLMPQAVFQTADVSAAPRQLSDVHKSPPLQA